MGVDQPRDDEMLMCHGSFLYSDKAVVIDLKTCGEYLPSFHIDEVTLYHHVHYHSVPLPFKKKISDEGDIDIDMPYPREVLNEIRWHPDLSMKRAEITYEHRGAPGDVKVISGREIRELGRSFFSTGDSSIPYHRIRRIVILSPRGEVETCWEFG